MAFQLQFLQELAQVETYQDVSLGTMRWGRRDAFPQTLLNLIEQSANAKPAVSRTAKFYKGAGFEGEDEIVSPQGLTLKKVVSILAEDYAVFEAFAIQCNYNMLGEVTSINPMRIADLRFNEFDELNYASKVGYHRDFSRNSVVRRNTNVVVTKDKIKWFDRFNPDAVGGQIEKAGEIDNYLGQILYHSESGYSSYPVPPLQAPINYVLSDVENSILMRKETSTGFINSYILKTTLDSEDATLRTLEAKIADAQGARGSGKIITFSGMSPEDLSATVLEEIGSGAQGAGAIVNSIKDAYELDKSVISGAYLIPPALAGIDLATGFSGADLKEAYFVYNAITQGGRDAIEGELNRILKCSVFKTRNIKIKKLKLDLDEVEETGAENKKQ